MSISIQYVLAKVIITHIHAPIMQTCLSPGRWDETTVIWQPGWSGRANMPEELRLEVRPRPDSAGV